MPELHHQLTQAIAALWPLLTAEDADARGPALWEVEAAFLPLERPGRILAALSLDLFSAQPGAVDEVMGRMAQWGEAHALLRQVMVGESPLPGFLDRLFEAYLSAEPLRLSLSDGDDPDIPPTALSVVAACALAARLPALLYHRQTLTEFPSRAMALPLGLAARAGDPGALRLLRDLACTQPYSGPIPDPSLLWGLWGLGNGSLLEGFTCFIDRAARAIREQGSWRRAAAKMCRALALVVGEAPIAPHWRRPLGAALLQFLSFFGDEERASQMVESWPQRVRDLVVNEGLSRLMSLPPAARAAVGRAYLSRVWELRAGDRLTAQLPLSEIVERERSPASILFMLDLVTGLGPALDEKVIQSLSRAWSDHPDETVRRRLAETFDSPSQQEIRPMEAVVLALPSRALARTPLGKLQAALWAGEGEKLVELAVAAAAEAKNETRCSLIVALEIPDAHLRRSIVLALSALGYVGDIPALLDAARRYRAIEGLVAQALNSQGARSAGEALSVLYARRLKWADDEAMDDYLALIGPEHFSSLQQALQTPYYPAARAGTARAIARHRLQEALFSLRSAAVSEKNARVRHVLFESLSRLTKSRPSPQEMAGYALLHGPIDSLTQTVERAREAAPASLVGVRRTLREGSWKRRRAACEVLATWPSSGAEPLLVESLCDGDESVRFAAAEALVQRGFRPETAREQTLLFVALRDFEEIAIQEKLLDTHTLIEALSFGGVAFRQGLLRVLGRMDWSVWPELSADERAILAAAQMDVRVALQIPRGVTAILRVIDRSWLLEPDRSRWVRELAAVPTRELLVAYEQEAWDWRVRQAVAMALGFRPEPEALACLGGLILDTDDDVRRAALQALAWRGDADAAEVLAGAFESPFQEDRDEASLALGACGHHGMEVLRRLMDDPWWEGRRGAASALAAWHEGSSLAADLLLPLAVDPEYRVSQAAREGLEAHGLLPSRKAVCQTLPRAQGMTVEGLEPWLGLGQFETAPLDIAEALDTMVDMLEPDFLVQRVALIAIFKAHHLALWLEEVALGQRTGEEGEALAAHAGLRLAASEALRTLTRNACVICHGEGTTRCPACQGAGDLPCVSCDGRGAVAKPCPNPACSAQEGLHQLGVKACSTCRNQGVVYSPCPACQAYQGRGQCSLCAGGGRLACRSCEGTGRLPNPGSRPT